MVLHLVLSLLLGVAQPVVQPPAAPEAPRVPAVPEVKPAPAGNEPAATKGSATPVLDLLEPVSRKAVEKHAAYFIVTQDGKYWDRQVWLQRQELRDRLKRSTSLSPVPTDAMRALGASKDAPADPYDHVDCIEFKSWQIKSGEVKKGYRYKVDHANPPMWRAIGGETAITCDEIDAARNAYRKKLSILEQGREAQKVRVAAFREVVAPEELAVAIRDGKAELSDFRWTRRVIEKAKPEKKNSSGGVTQKAEPEEAEYSWFRDAVVVRWKKDGKG